MKQILAVLVLLASCTSETQKPTDPVSVSTPAPYKILGRRGTKNVKVDVSVPATATLAELSVWSTEIASAESRGGNMMINFYVGATAADNMIASYSNGTLYDTRDK